MTIRVPHDLALIVGGAVGKAWQRFFDDVAKALNAAATQLTTTVQTSRLINAGAGLKGGGDLSSDRAFSLYVYVGAVSGLPTSGLTPGDHAYASNGRNAGEGAGSGTGSEVVWSGTIWRIPGVATAVAA